jgi:multidrug transporter EmrE-like cation transporter
MERLVQYLDDLEDLFYAVALKAERIREALQYLLLISGAAILQVFAISMALRHPPLALAVAALLLVGMLLHAVLNYSPDAYAN